MVYAVFILKTICTYPSQIGQQKIVLLTEEKSSGSMNYCISWVSSCRQGNRGYMFPAHHLTYDSNKMWSSEVLNSTIAFLGGVASTRLLKQCYGHQWQSQQGLLQWEARPTDRDRHYWSECSLEQPGYRVFIADHIALSSPGNRTKK